MKSTGMKDSTIIVICLVLYVIFHMLAIGLHPFFFIPEGFIVGFGLGHGWYNAKEMENRK